MMPPYISVIIVNYNAGMELSACVRSVAETAEHIEIIVVDNNSSDESISLLLEHYKGEKKLRIVQNSTNFGFAVACNQGSMAAKGQMFFYLNPDCIVAPETIPTLRHVLEIDPEVGMAGGLIMNNDGSEQRGCRRDIPTPWKSFVNSFGLKRLVNFNQKLFSDFRLDREPIPDTPMVVDAISGACMLIRKEDFVDIGPMDEGYFLHCEDLDWCMRFGQRGRKVMFVPQARLWHSKGSCSASRPVLVEWFKHKGMIRFYGKFFADEYPAPMFRLVQLGIWLRFCLSLVKIFVSRWFKVGKSGC